MPLQWGVYLPVINTCLQTLLCIAAGWLAAWRGAFRPWPNTAVCRVLNQVVVTAFLPALQFWLLSIKTDMRNMENWRALAACCLWTLLVQAGCAAWVIALEGGDLDRVGAHALVLTANNTGILAPVVLEAAIGPGSGPIGMLATIPLYFMQLPGSVLLFELQRRGRARGSGGGRGRGRAELEGGQQRQWQRHEGGGSDDDDGGADGEDWPLTADGGEEGAKGHSSIGGSGGRGLGGNGGRIAEEVPLLRQLFSSNLVFSTAAAALTSLAGLQSYLDPAAPTHITGLGWVEGALAWLARCCVPVTLFSLGLWSHTSMSPDTEPPVGLGADAAQQQQQQQHGTMAAASPLAAAPSSGTSSSSKHGRDRGGGTAGGATTPPSSAPPSWRLAACYLVLKLLVLPWVMVFVNGLLGLSGRMARALVVLTCVPVGNMAFVVSEQYGVGTGAVAAVMVAGVLLLLPHVVMVMAAMDAVGAYPVG